MAFKCDDCPYCAFHDVEPAICDNCEDGSEFEPDESEDSLSAKATAATIGQQERMAA